MYKKEIKNGKKIIFYIVQKAQRKNAELTRRRHEKKINDFDGSKYYVLKFRTLTKYIIFVLVNMQILVFKYRSICNLNRIEKENNNFMHRSLICFVLRWID